MSRTADGNFAHMVRTDEAANIAGLNTWTFQRLRRIGAGPGYHVHRGVVLYNPSDVMAWAASRRGCSDSKEQEHAK